MAAKPGVSVQPLIIKLIEVEKLHFDPENPRLAAADLPKGAPDEEVLRYLWDEMDVAEIAMSIVAGGFYPHQPIIVAREKGKLIVIEGNRRLAAVKTLLSPKLFGELGKDCPKPSKNLTDSLLKLPCVESSREEIWRFLGFQHVNGPSRWGSYAKAKYVAHVHRDYGVPMSKISQTIGDRHRTVLRLYRALMVIEQAERHKLYSIKNRTKSNLPFSHLYIGLDYPGFQSFLNLKPEDDESREPVPSRQHQNLAQVLRWLFGDKKSGQESVIHSQNPDLRILDKVLLSADARSALKSGSALKDAVVYAVPEMDRLRENLIECKRLLVDSRGLITQGYKGEPDLLQTAGSVANLAADLYDEMERKTVRRPTRVTE